MPEKPTPDTYFADIPEPLSAAARGLRSLVLAAAPNLREVIKWGSPVYEGNKQVMWIKAQKKHLTFGFFRGSELAQADPQGLLEGSGKSMRHLKIRTLEDTGRAAVRSLVDAAVQLDEASP